MGVLERLRTTRLDAALAGAFVIAGLVQAAFVPIASPGLGELFILGSTLPLAWRRTYPVEAALASAAFWLIPLDGYPVLGFVVVILQFFALGNRGEPGRAVVLSMLAATATSVIGTMVGPEDPVAAIGACLVVVGPTVAGRLVRHQQRQNQALVALTRELAVERSKVHEAAVGAERARIAQELHDVVGHEMTLIAIQAEAAAAALRVTPDRAVGPVEAIRSTAHRTLSEMRSVLDVLAPAGEADEPPSEGLASLADRARLAGIANSLSVTGSPAPEQAPVSLAVNRIVRECLTNAGRHAPGQVVTLQVDWTPSRVQVRAVNPTAEHRQLVPGRGLTGIRHRAELFGGTFEATTEDGRFDVRVSIPTGADG